MLWESELAAALAAAHLASDLLLKEYQAFQAIPQAPASITTDADRLAQETILTYLRQSFPQDAICAEEDTPGSAAVPKTGPRLWVVDPIDGTRGFARKNGEFSVMIGFVVEGQIALGVVAEPALGRLTYAVRGGGCWRQDNGAAEPLRCRVSSTEQLSAATLTQSRSKGTRPSRPVEVLAPSKVVETYSAGIKLALVARAEADLYVNTYDAFHDWDICAGQILVEEAGGQVSGLQGEPLQYGLPGAWQRAGLLATNGRLHAAALQTWQGEAG